MIETEIDLDALLDGESSLRSGIFRLWLAVFLSAFFALKDGRDYAPGARDFLFGDNPFFDFVADEMGYEPGGLRERIRKALKRGRCEKQGTPFY
ncbi:MAG: hypothetical protein NTV58_06670 [Deltaproteobacteria bacterium]|nr:hypothetical protein [Deltaproteobacteria bacterium]